MAGSPSIPRRHGAESLSTSSEGSDHSRIRPVSKSRHRGADHGNPQTSAVEARTSSRRRSRARVGRGCWRSGAPCHPGGHALGTTPPNRRRLTRGPREFVDLSSSVFSFGRRGIRGSGRPGRIAQVTRYLRTRVPFTSARSTIRSPPSTNASSAPTGSSRSTPRSSARWLRVPTGMQAKGNRSRGSGRHDRLGPVPAGRRERVGSVRECPLRERFKGHLESQLDRLDPAPASLVGDAKPLRLAIAGFGVEEQHGV